MNVYRIIVSITNEFGIQELNSGDILKSLRHIIIPKYFNLCPNE